MTKMAQMQVSSLSSNPYHLDYFVPQRLGMYMYLEGRTCSARYVAGSSVSGSKCLSTQKKDEITLFKDLYICQDCGTGTVIPKPSVGEISKFYDLPTYYTHGAKAVEEHPTFMDRLLTKAVWTFDRARPFDVAEMAGSIRQHGRVLDIGCGSGKLLSEFAAFGHDVVGVDPDPKAREQAIGRGLTALEGAGESLPSELPDKSFDLIIMTHSLEHCVDPVAALNFAKAKLRNNGLIYIEVPNSGCIHFETMLRCSENFDTPRHLWFFKERGLRKILEKCDFAVEDWRYHGLTRHHLPSWRNWETEIAARLDKRGEKGRSHRYMTSLAMLAREIFAKPLRKYDAMGVIARC